MNLWNQHDLKVMETREKAILLKEEFDKKHGINIKDYSQKLNRFLDRRLKQESDLILKRHLFLTIFSLASLNRKIYK
ncbi:MAG: hypothetical protein IB618_00845 [Candidatus Pacearchaeota archaeon]|nr:MAG: hypothetical protein IB618_00845 [Candidatus Pacearchaeota archaeon]